MFYFFIIININYSTTEIGEGFFMKHETAGNKYLSHIVVREFLYADDLKVNSVNYLQGAIEIWHIG